MGVVVICRDVPRSPQPALAALQEETGVSLRRSPPQSGTKQPPHSSRRAADVREFHCSWWWEQTASPCCGTGDHTVTSNGWDQPQRLAAGKARATKAKGELSGNPFTGAR